MNNATRITVSTFGAITGLAGLEHGIGEALQGNVAPEGVAFLSWPRSEFFAILNGEPAMSVVPNMLVSGLLTIGVSVAFLLWVTIFIGRKHGGAVLMVLSVALLLVGGGFSPPVLGLVLGLVATRIEAPLAWWRTHLHGGLGRVLGELWPWLLAACIAAWLLLMPGLSLLDYVFKISIADNTVYAVILAAAGSMAVAIVAALARDAQARGRLPRPSSLAVARYLCKFH